MSVIVAILLYVFGLDPSTGQIEKHYGGNLIFTDTD
jgi:hypothetical protein